MHVSEFISINSPHVSELVDLDIYVLEIPDEPEVLEGSDSVGTVGVANVGVTSFRWLRRGLKRHACRNRVSDLAFSTNRTQ